MVAIALVIPLSVEANIKEVVFVNEPQSIMQNRLSRPFTLELHDNSGLRTPAGEPLDLFLVSSSPTGEFSSSPNGKKVKALVVNSSFSRRTFYYQDSTVGEYLITVRLKSRSSGALWAAVQEVHVTREEITTQPMSITISSSISKPKPPHPLTMTTPRASTTDPVPPTEKIEVKNTTAEKESWWRRLWSFFQRLFF